MSIKKSVLKVAVFCLLPAIIAITAPSPAIGGPLMAPAATPNSVTLTWTAPGDDGSSGTATEYDIRYSLSPITDANWASATQVSGEPTPQPAGSQESFDVIGLSPGTTYYFAIKTADEVPNWSALSNIVLKTTSPEDTPPANIADLSTGTATFSSIALHWTAPGDDGSTGTATEYDIRYAAFVITDANWNSAAQVTGEPSPQPAGSAENFTVTGLNSTTTYYFAIKTADEIPNWSGLSNIAAGTTSDVPTPPEPPILVAPADGAIDLTQPVELDWNIISGVDYYQLQLADNSAMSSPLRDTTTQNSGYSADNLDNGATYYWRARAHNQYGWGNWSVIRNFTTVCPQPDPPLLVSPADGATDVPVPVLFDWADVTGATLYHLQVDETSNFASPVVNTNSSASYYNATNLIDGQSYYWRVRAQDDCGWSDWSTVWNINTVDTALPAAVGDLLAATGDGHGEIDLTWTAVGDDGTVGTATSYDIRYSLSTINNGTWNSATRVNGEPAPQPAGTGEQFTVTGLEPGVTYYFAMKVADESGNESPLSNVTSAQPADMAPPAAIDDLSGVTGSDDGEIILSWTAPGDDGHDGGMVSAYLIKYSREYLTEANWDSASMHEAYVMPQPPGHPQAAMLSGLEPGERYYVGIKCYDECANCSPLSNVASAEAGVDIILDVDDAVAAAVSPGDGAVVHSSRPLLTVRNIPEPGDNEYFFEVASDSFFIDVVAISPPVPEQGGDITKWKVDEKLSSNQTYFWRARANDYSYSATLSFAVQSQAHAYPNPFRPAHDENVTFTDLPDGANVFLTSVSGNMVREWTNIIDDNLTWDGTNDTGTPVASGTYLWFIENTDSRGKIILVR